MKTVLITGASRGIGAATARKFASCGWAVALHYYKEETLAQAIAGEIISGGGRAVVIQGDLSSSAEAKAVVQGAEDALGALDALVCCAGVALPQQLVTDTTDEQWRQVMGIDLDGVFYTIRSAVPSFVRRQSGAIVTVSSMWGVTGASCEVAYSAAKAGVIGLTKALAKELGPSNIRVNCVAPGVIATDMNRHLLQTDLASLAEETPLCRIGTPEETAESIYFLAAQQSGFITGQVLQVDGGMVI